MDQYTLIDIVEFTSPENCKKIVEGLEIFKYFERSIRIETMIKYGLNKWTCPLATADGNLKCLKCAYENGCPMDIYTYIYASCYGQLECLKYALENACHPKKKNSFTYEVYIRYFEYILYAVENRCPIFDTILTDWNVECLKYIIHWMVNNHIEYEKIEDKNLDESLKFI